MSHKKQDNNKTKANKKKDPKKKLYSKNHKIYELILRASS